MFIKEKYYLITIIYLCIFKLNAQTAFQNFGTIQIHTNGKLGFHTNLVNDGTFDQNKGLVGFYNNNNFLEVLGANKPVFYNVEVDVVDDLYLETSVGVTNNLSFITGKVQTPRDNTSISLEFLNYNVYSGEGDNEYVDGYVLTENIGEFIFPIGDDDSFRPMIIPNQEVNTYYKGAYFKENPNSPTTFLQSFNTKNMQFELSKINEEEFWDLDGNMETNVVLTWDSTSKINLISNDIKNLRVVGWDKITGKWVDLGSENVVGNINEGSIKSSKFIPNDYDVLTIGSDLRNVLGVITSKNYGISPNGDGINDTFVIEGLELYPNNTLKILNRWGAVVYSTTNYKNDWDGISEHELTIGKKTRLPAGTYFYILYLNGKNSSRTGYIYLNR